MREGDDVVLKSAFCRGVVLFVHGGGVGEDSVAWFEFRGGDGGAGCCDCAGDVGADYVGEFYPGHYHVACFLLYPVDGVDGYGAGADDEFIWAWRGVGRGADF